MIERFIKGNKIAIKTAFKWTSLIFTSIVLIIFLIALINNQKPDLGLFIAVVLSASIGFPIFIIIVGFLRWYRDSFVTDRNLGSFPFSQLDIIGFKKVTKNEYSKTKFLCDFYTANIVGFKVDCDVETQYESERVRFKYYVRTLCNEDFKRIQRYIKAKNGFFGFNWIAIEYHYKNHRLTSVMELKKELIDFGKLLHRENIEPGDYTNR